MLNIHQHSSEARGSQAEQDLPHTLRSLPGLLSIPGGPARAWELQVDASLLWLGKPRPGAQVAALPSASVWGL